MKQISLLIATYNRASILQETLYSFTKLNAARIKWEIIIIDNNSSDHTEKIVSKFANRLPIKYLFEQNQGKNYALNLGIKHASGDIIVLTDDDVTPERKWLHEIIEATHRWPNVRVFGGRVEPVFPCRVGDRIANGSFSSYVFAKYHPYETERICVNTYPVGANCWFRREIFDDGFMYDPNIGPKGKGRISGSELEFFVRLAKAGEKIVYVPSALVFHRIQKYQLSFSYLLKRAYAGGRGWVRIYNPWEDSVRFFGVPRFLYRNILEEIAFFFIYLVRGKNILEPIMKLSEYFGCIKEFREKG